MLIAKNRKALFNYEIVEKFVAGIVLKGYEVKALREKNVNFEGAYITTNGSEAFLQNLQIGKYSRQSQEVDDFVSKRPRRLLLEKHELLKLQRELSEKGKTAVPLAILLLNNLIKLEFAIVKGKKKHEKKQLLKDRQIEIDLRKSIKGEAYL